MATKEEFIEMMEPDEATRQKLNLLAAFVKSLDNTEIVKAQKDLEILKVQKDIEILKVQKDMKIAESQFCAEIKALEANVLKLSSACTSRGIFEFALKGVYSELGLKGTFNASAVCKVLIDYVAAESSESSPKTAASLNQMRWTKGVIAAADKCKLDLMSLYELYGILCSQIHGHPWSGPSVLVISKELSPQNTCFLRSLADIVGLQVDEVQGSSDTGAALKLGGL